jgi:hypothetical protein
MDQRRDDLVIPLTSITDLPGWCFVSRLAAMTPETASLPEFVLDGGSFDDLTGFFVAITQTLKVTAWGTNLDAFNDILRGGFGTREGGFVL